MQTIHKINHVVSGTLRIGTFTSVSVNWLPYIIKQFSERYPNVRFELLAGDYNEITERIRCGKIDCGFLTAPVTNELFFQKLYCDPMLVVLPPNHPLASKTALTFADIKKEPFIIPMKGSDQDIRSITDKYIKKLDVRYTLNDDFSVISLVNHGFGITIMPELILKNFKPNVASIPFMPEQYREIGIAALPHMSILTKTFVKFLSENGT